VKNKLIATASLLLLCGIDAALPQNQTASFRITSRLVDVTVVALDKSGNPVADLKKDDFAVSDTGKPRSLSICRYEGRTATEGGAGEAKNAAAPPLLPPFVYTNRAEAGVKEDRNITALVIDSANTDAQDLMFVKAQAGKLLRALAPQTHVAVYQLGSDFTVIHDLTDDMAVLREHLDKVAVKVQAQRLSDIERAALDAEAILDQIEARKSHYATPVFRAVQAGDKAAIAGEVNANTFIQANRVESTLTALEFLGRHLSSVPGRRSIVWISGGISIFSQRVSTRPDNQPDSPLAGDNRQNAILRTAERLAQLGVSLYGVDAHGVKTGAESLAQRQYPPMIAGRYSEMERATAQNSDSRAAFSLLTSITGGRYIFGTNDLSEGVDKVTSDMRGTYSLGFYATEEPDGKWHPLKVAVRRPDVRLLYKEGYLADPSPVKQQVWDEEAQRLAMLSPFGSDGIRLTARCAPAANAAPGLLLLTLQIEAEDLMWREESGRMTGSAEVYIGEKTADGKVRFQSANVNARFLPPQMETARSQGLPYRRQWKPGVDTKGIRVLVRDPATGRLGTLDIRM
jgi:VWFA-related protein